MATSFFPYLFFSGDCRQAFERYHQIFGGDVTILSNADTPDGGMPDAPADFVMHAAIQLPEGGLLMGSDDPSGDGGPKAGYSVNVSVADVAEANRVFDALAAEGGSVDMPMEETFFSPAFGGVTDRFGVSWLVSADPVGT